jgi:hypothetical protein
MFNVSKFNQPIGDWYVSNVTDMIRMFSVSEFNQPIGDWDVSGVIDKTDMFLDCKISPIPTWYP